MWVVPFLGHSVLEYTDPEILWSTLLTAAYYFAAAKTIRLIFLDSNFSIPKEISAHSLVRTFYLMIDSILGGQVARSLPYCRSRDYIIATHDTQASSNTKYTIIQVHLLDKNLHRRHRLRSAK